MTASNDGISEFKHAGLKCKIVRTDMGHWCGYVRVPDEMPPTRWESDYDSKHDEILAAEVEVWGGVTYGPDGDGWVGFDNAHARDLVDHREFNTEADAVKNETQRLAEQIADINRIEQ
jgi:hypothetical protein